MKPSEFGKTVLANTLMNTAKAMTAQNNSIFWYGLGS